MFYGVRLSHVWHFTYDQAFLHDFLSFALMLVAFGANVMLSWKPLFLSASQYIGIDSVKTTSLEEMSKIRLAIALGISLITV